MELIKRIYFGIYIIYLRVYIFWNNDLQSHKHKSRGVLSRFPMRDCIWCTAFSWWMSLLRCSPPNAALRDRHSGEWSLLSLCSGLLLLFWASQLRCSTTPFYLPHKWSRGWKTRPHTEASVYLKQCMCSRLSKAF